MKKPAPCAKCGSAPREMRSYCGPCNREQQRKYARKYCLTNPHAKARARKTHVKRTYGLAPEEYDQLRAAQGGVCAICRRPETAERWPGVTSSLSVDHSHATGNVRGLLCGNCNRGLGYFQDNPELLVAGASYLHEHNKDSTNG